MAKYVFEYVHTSANLSRANDVYKGKRSFNTIKEVRSFAYVKPNRFGQVMADYKGYIYDMSGKIVAAIDGDVYIYKQNGKLYCRFMNKGGVLDSRHGKIEYIGKYKF